MGKGRRRKRRQKVITLAKAGGHGSEGRFQVGQGVAENPYRKGEFQCVTRNIKHDVVEWLFARNLIDEAERQAGLEFAKLVEGAGIVGAKAIDFSRDVVDGGGALPDMAVQRIEATKRLIYLAEKIGRESYELLWVVLVNGIPLWEVATQIDKSDGPTTQYRKRYFARMFRNALNEAAIVWKMADRGSTRRDQRKTGWKVLTKKS